MGVDPPTPVGLLQTYVRAGDILGTSQRTKPRPGRVKRLVRDASRWQNPDQDPPFTPGSVARILSQV